MGRAVLIVAALIAVPLVLWFIASRPSEAVTNPPAVVTAPRTPADAGSTAPVVRRSPAETTKGERFEGVVVSADGGAPVGCALVRWGEVLDGHALTTADGRFTLVAPEYIPAPAVIEVFGDGYADLTTDFHRGAAPLTLTLTPLPRYEGKVIDEHGRAVEHFTANGVSFERGRLSLPFSGKTFEMVVVAPGFRPLISKVDPTDPDHVFELDTGAPDDLLQQFYADAGTPAFPPGSEGAQCPWLYRRFGARFPN